MICLTTARGTERTTSVMTSASFKAGMTRQTMIDAGCSGVNLLENALFPENEFRSGEIIFDAALLANPREIAFNPFFQAHCWRVTSLPNHGSIGCQVPHFSRAKLAIHDRCEPYLQCIGNQFGHPFDGDRSTTSDVHGLSV